MSVRAGWITRHALPLMVTRSLRQHALSTCITVLSVALASGLVMAVFAVNAQTYRAFTGGPVGFDAVLGARGSRLQLVLNTVFHLETSPGNIPWSMYQSMKKDPRVTLAVPFALGDNYHGFRIVGVTEELFTEFEYENGKGYRVYPGGRVFKSDRVEAVIGSYVAQKMNLTVGSTIHPYHGLTFDEKAKHEQEYLVVGVMEPTNTPADRVIWIPIDGIFRMDGHVLRGSGEAFTAKKNEEIPDEHKEISAVMLTFSNPQAGFMLAGKINNQGDRATLAYPIGETMMELFSKIGWVTRVLELVAYLVVVVAAASILASIYNTMNERRREFAILRALGARRGTVFAAIVSEASVIAALGALAGYAVYAVILFTAAQVIRAQTGVVLEAAQWHPVFAWAPMGMIALGALAGVIPAVKAYRTDVASNLN